MHIIPVETVCLPLKKLKIHLLYDPATLFLEIKIYVQKIYTQMFLAALCVIIPNWKQL